MDFKEEFIKNFIPAVEKMIEKEEKHLASLIERREDMFKRSKWFFSLFSYCFSHGIELASAYIEGSEINLEYLKKTLANYKDFADNL